MAYAKDLEPTPTLRTSSRELEHDQGLDADVAAYTGCSPQSLRILASFVIQQASRHALDLPGFAPQLNSAQTSCEQIHTLSDLARSRREGASLLDRLLTLLVEPEARTYRSMAPYALAQSWEASREPLRGKQLAAFLWVLIKKSSIVTRRIEEKVIRTLECDCFQLLAD